MMSKRLKAFAYEVLTSGQSHGEMRKRAENAYQYSFGTQNHHSPSVFQCFVFYSLLRSVLKTNGLSPRAFIHKFVLSLHFSSVEAIIWCHTIAPQFQLIQMLVLRHGLPCEGATEE